MKRNEIIIASFVVAICLLVSESIFIFFTVDSIVYLGESISSRLFYSSLVIGILLLALSIILLFVIREWIKFTSQEKYKKEFIDLEVKK